MDDASQPFSKPASSRSPVLPHYEPPRVQKLPTMDQFDAFAAELDQVDRTLAELDA